MRISEHLPKIAKFADRMAVVRSMTTKEGEHPRPAELMHTGRLSQDQIQYPALGSLIAQELYDREAVLPGFVSIGPNCATSPAAHSPGFLWAELCPAGGRRRRLATLRPGQARRAACCAYRT